MKFVPQMQQTPEAGGYHQVFQTEIDRIYSLLEETEKPQARLLMKLNGLYAAAMLGYNFDDKEVKDLIDETETIRLWFKMAILMHQAGLSPVEEKIQSHAKFALSRKYPRTRL